MDTLAVVLVVALAAVYLIQRVIKSSDKNACSCGCTSCHISDSCDHDAERSIKSEIPIP